MLILLRRRKSRSGRPIRETAARHYLSAVPTALSNAKRNVITQKNPTCMIDLLTTLYIDQRIPAIEEAQRLLQALLPESRGAKELFLISGALYNAGNSTPTLRTAGGSWPDMTKTVSNHRLEAVFI